jgi:hypothetical protein
LGPGEWTPENVAASWDAITASEAQEVYDSGADQTKKFLVKAAQNLGLDLNKG